MPVEKFANRFATTLSAAVADTTGTSISVANAAPTALQGGQFRVRVGDELMLVTATGAAGASPWTVTRGVEGSTATTHASGAAVTHVLTEASLKLLNVRHGWQPFHQKLLLATYDGAEASGSTRAYTTLTPYVRKLYVVETVTLADVLVVLGQTGATLTAGSNMAGVYDSAGTLICKTADQSATWTTNGEKIMALTAEAGQSLTITGGADVYVYLALLAAGTTTPGFVSRVPPTSVPGNAGLVQADGWRIGRLAAVASGSGLPASFAPASAITQSIYDFWMGLR